MADWQEIGTELWKELQELDVEAVQAEAEKQLRIAFIGAAECGKTALARALAGPSPSQVVLRNLEQTILEYRLPLLVEDVTKLEFADLLILLMDATKGDYAQEVAAAEYLSYLGKPMLVCYSKMDLLPNEARMIRGQAHWRGAEIMPLSAAHPDTVEDLLLPAMLEAIPEHVLGLARQLPLFRSKVAAKLVERAALVNATYASASGLAESIPLLGMPLNTQDIKVLSSNLASLMCRLSLAYGLPSGWREELRTSCPAEQVSNLWKQLAQQVRGLVPVWGLDSKVRVAYGGTLLTGRVVEAWCDTGGIPQKDALRGLCRDAATESRAVSADLVARARDALPSAHERRARSGGLRLRLPHAVLSRRSRRPTCPECGRSNPADAAFCAYCGAGLERADREDV